MTRLLKIGTAPLRYGEKRFNEKEVYFADEYLFDVFDVAVTKGDPKSSLKDPFCVMLSETIAKNILEMKTL